jgi:hypothetical protein
MNVTTLPVSVSDACHAKKYLKKQIDPMFLHTYTATLLGELDKLMPPRRKRNLKQHTTFCLCK